MVSSVVVSIDPVLSMVIIPCCGCCNLSLILLRRALFAWPSQGSWWVGEGGSCSGYGLSTPGLFTVVLCFFLPLCFVLSVAVCLPPVGFCVCGSPTGCFFVFCFLFYNKDREELVW